MTVFCSLTLEGRSSTGSGTYSVSCIFSFQISFLVVKNHDMPFGNIWFISRNSVEKCVKFLSKTTFTLIHRSYISWQKRILMCLHECWHACVCMCVGGYAHVTAPPVLDTSFSTSCSFFWPAKNTQLTVSIPSAVILWLWISGWLSPNIWIYRTICIFLQLLSTVPSNTGIHNNYFFCD